MEYTKRSTGAAMLNLRILLQGKSRRRLSRQLDIGIHSRLRRTLITLVTLLLLHVLAMTLLEAMSLNDALWLTMTTVTTVGYGDYSAATPMGRAATVALLYVAGVTLLARLASDYIEYRLLRKTHMIKGQWRWKMQDHIVIINSPRSGEEIYFQRLISQLRAGHYYRDYPVQILTRTFPEGLPKALRDLGVVHYNGDPDDAAALRAVNVDKAKAIIILARDENRRDSDSITLDILLRLRELAGERHAYTVAESVLDENRGRFLKQGVNATLRPIRAYPEILVQALVAPGAEQVLENLFTYHDDHAGRYAVTLENAIWSEVVCALINADLGTAMAYVTKDEQVVCHPAANHRFSAQALILMVRDTKVPASEEVQAVLAPSPHGR